MRSTLRDNRGVVSVWIGSLENDATFRMYLGEDEAIWSDDGIREFQELSVFWSDLAAPDFNLGLARQCREFYFRQTETPHKPSELVADFPYALAFAEALETSCVLRGVRMASTVICIYDNVYCGKGVFAFGKLEFCGVLDYVTENFPYVAKAEWPICEYRIDRP